jgi:hypothetical protein
MVASASYVISSSLCLWIDRYGLEVGTESCVPGVLLEAYLNNAELRLLQGDAFEAIAYWWEVRRNDVIRFDQKVIRRREAYKGRHWRDRRGEMAGHTDLCIDLYIPFCVGMYSPLVRVVCVVYGLPTDLSPPVCSACVCCTCTAY